jgi:multicomponent Na+:H+ antiporter subunit A
MGSVIWTHWSVIAPVLGLGFVLSLLARLWPFIPKALPAFAPMLAWGLLFFQKTNQTSTAFQLEWYRSLGIDFSLSLSPLSLWMSHLILGIGTCTAFYGVGYFEKRAKVLKFLSMLLMFMTAMLGLVCSTHLLVLFIFWECTSFISFLMVGFYHEKEAAQTGGRRALLITGAGGLAMMTGFVLLGQIGGSYEVGILSTKSDLIRGHEAYPLVLILILLGAFTKSAQFPFHFWLPGAMAAPTPASCYLHSATMVKAGVFLLALLSGVLGGTVLWKSILVSVGAFTLLFGSVNSLFNVDLKAILANTTFAVLGVLVMLIGVGTPAAMKAMVLFLTGHALYKATLFMSAGILDHHMGTRHLNKLKGLRKRLPLTSMAAFLAAISMSGLPGTFGFLAKEYKYKSLLGMGNALGMVLLVASILASAMMMLAALQVGWRPYHKQSRKDGDAFDDAIRESGLKGGSKSDLKDHATQVPEIDPHRDEKDAEHSLLFLPPLFLGIFGIVIGVMPSLISPILLPASEYLGGSGSKIKLWHGWNAALFASAVTVTIGFVLWFMRHRFQLADRVPFGLRGFDSGLVKTIKASKNVSFLMQMGELRWSIIIVAIATFGLIFWKLCLHQGLPKLEAFSPLEILPITLCVVMALGAFAAIESKNLYRAVLSLSICGFASSMLFMVYGAPDLAITQISVDVLLSILFVAILSKMPDVIPEERGKGVWLQRLVVMGFGFGLSLIVLKSMSLEISPSISRQLGEWSKSVAHGSNVVNVILVDFRAMDTMAEITVLCICALGISALGKALNFPWVRSEQKDLRSEFLFQESSRKLYPIFFILAFLAYWRGHQLPGGGFIGGLIMALGMVLYHISYPDRDPEWFRGRMAMRLMGLGLGLSMLASFLGWLWEDQYFKGLWLPEFHLPLLGEIHLGSPMLFDLGVMVVVTTFAVKTVQRFMEIE